MVRYRPEDRRAVDALYRRVFGIDAAEASRLRWDWQYRRNPNNSASEPEIWIARGSGPDRALRHDAGAAVAQGQRFRGPGAWMSWSPRSVSGKVLGKCCSARGTGTWVRRSARPLGIVACCFRN